MPKVNFIPDYLYKKLTIKKALKLCGFDKNDFGIPEKTYFSILYNGECQGVPADIDKPH